MPENWNREIFFYFTKLVFICMISETGKEVQNSLLFRRYRVPQMSTYGDHQLFRISCEATLRPKLFVRESVGKHQDQSMPDADLG